MRPDYLTECLASSVCGITGEFKPIFLPEESYEWGDKSSFLLLTKTQILWSEACRKWRVASQCKSEIEINNESRYENKNENSDENKNKNKNKNKNENKNENENENENENRNEYQVEEEYFQK